jgi:hypothetical protein
MISGEWLTRVTIWLALAAHALEAGCMLRARRGAHPLLRSRWPWTIGCAFFFAYGVCAFRTSAPNKEALGVLAAAC